MRKNDKYAPGPGVPCAKANEAAARTPAPGLPRVARLETDQTVAHRCDRPVLGSCDVNLHRGKTSLRSRLSPVESVYHCDQAAGRHRRRLSGDEHLIAACSETLNSPHLRVGVRDSSNRGNEILQKPLSGR